MYRKNSRILRTQLLNQSPDKKAKVKPLKLEEDTDDGPGIDTEADPYTPLTVKDEKEIACSLKTTTFGLKKQTLKKRLCSY